MRRSALPNEIPDDELSQLLTPLYDLSDAELGALPDPGQSDLELLPNDLLLEFRRDGTPTWWPLRRTWNGEDWKPSERRQVLLQRLCHYLPRDFPKKPSSSRDVRRLIDSLRLVAHLLHIGETGPS
jgi:hypothetical protein